MKGFVEGVYSPIDDTTIETKKETTERRHRRYCENIGMIAGGVILRSSLSRFGHTLGFSRKLVQKLTPIWQPRTSALSILPVPPGRITY